MPSEFITKCAREIGAEPELVRESEWSIEYKIGKMHWHESKFMEGLQVTFAEFLAKWEAMDDAEKIYFGQDYCCKTDITSEDVKILDYLMEHSTTRLPGTISQIVLRHPDRDRAIQFLIDHADDDENSPNVVQALGMSGDKRGVPVLRPIYERLQKEIAKEKELGIPEGKAVFFGPIPYSRFLGCCGALMKTDGSPEYEEVLREFLKHPHKQVRRWAAMSLGEHGDRSEEFIAHLKKASGLGRATSPQTPSPFARLTPATPSPDTQSRCDSCV